MCGRRLIDKSFLTLMQYVTSLTPIWRIASTMFWPCETKTSTCRNFATISSGLYRFLAITVLLDVKDIPQVGLLQRGRINAAVQLNRNQTVIFSGTFLKGDKDCFRESS